MLPIVSISSFAERQRERLSYRVFPRLLPFIVGLLVANVDKMENVLSRVITTLLFIGRTLYSTYRLSIPLPETLTACA